LNAALARSTGATRSRYSAEGVRVVEVAPPGVVAPGVEFPPVVDVLLFELLHEASPVTAAIAKPIIMQKRRKRVISLPFKQRRLIIFAQHPTSERRVFA
jgi:hypothetical protein